MPNGFEPKNKLELRQAVGHKLNTISPDTFVFSKATGDGSTSTLVDNYGLAKGDSGDYNGRQIQVDSAGTTAASVGQRSFGVTLNTSTRTLTINPVVDGIIKDGQEYEMWKGHTIESIDNAINQAINEAAGKGARLIKEVHNVFTEASTYQYILNPDFSELSKVEYCQKSGVYKQLHSCDYVWDELVDSDVTASVETSLFKEGSGSLKLVVAAGCSAGDKLATANITSVDLGAYDEIEIWIYSTVALAAGDIQLLLDNTAQCSSPLETLDIPATTAYTWTRHVISLANPSSDTGIISVGLKMITDKGAFTLYADDIRVENSNSRLWKELDSLYWFIAQGSAQELSLTQTGLSLAGSPTMLRLTGYRLPELLTDDTTDCDIDPDFIVKRVVADTLSGNAYWAALAQNALSRMHTNLLPNTRKVL